MKHYFVSTDTEAQRQFRDAVITALDVLDKYGWNNTKSFDKGVKPVDKFEILQKGEKLEDILTYVGKNILAGGINLSNPHVIAHMHCQPTIASIVAELLIAATNQSMDSWDESPAATYVEQAVIKKLCTTFGYGENSDGIFDSGGTMSNQTAVLLARDKFAERELSMHVKISGLPPSPRMKILCSEQAHFSIDKAAYICGLGTDAVVKVPVTDELVMDPDMLNSYLQKEHDKGSKPFLVVATAGTTNAGNIPNLRKIGEIAKQHKLWYHVDAAYGGALAFSTKYKHLIDGIDQADSITWDPHKLGYVPISCGVFLLADRQNFEYLTFHSDYLNPKSETDDGLINLVDKSLQTTRRFDALKLYVNFQTLGLEGYDQLISGSIDDAQEFAEIISGENDFELSFKPHTNILLFRYLGEETRDLNDLNTKIKETSYFNGGCALSKTMINDTVYLKATCMNQLTKQDDFKEILDCVREAAS